MRDVRQETRIKIQQLSQLGYRFKEIWECEWNRMIQADFVFFFCSFFFFRCKAEMFQSCTLIRKLKKFSESFDRNNIFPTIITNGGIGKGVGDIGKDINKNDIYGL